MKQNKEILKGYKDSPLGVIPEEWEVKRLEEICTFLNGRAYKQAELLSNGKYPVLRVGNFFTNNNWYYSNLDLEEDKYAINGDLLYAWSASFGPRFWSGEKVIYHYHIWKITNYTKVKSKYLFYLLDYDANLLQNMQQGGTMAHITKGDMERRLVALPPIFEQQKIAEILATWDKAIENQTALIEKLELCKRGLMQQLFTGKKRLKGLGESWKKYQIKDIANEVSLRNKANNKNIVVLSCTKYDGLVPSLDYFGRKIFADNLSTYKIVPQNNFAYATNHIEEGSIGYQSKFHEALISPMYTVFQTTEFINDSFLFALLKTHKYILEYRKRMEGSIDRRGGLRWDEFSKIKIMLPPFSEQITIAKVLMTADKEIELARTKLITLRSQKSGLMQQLLTGKKRINHINS